MYLKWVLGTKLVEIFSDVLSEEVEKELKEVVEVSMGTEIGDLDVWTSKHWLTSLEYDGIPCTIIVI